MDLDVETIWRQLDEHVRAQPQQEEATSSPPACKQCGSDNFLQSRNHEMVCSDCGLVAMDLFIETSYSAGGFYNESTERGFRPAGKGSKRIQQMQEWYRWTNEEKNAYKLANYTKSLCKELAIPESLIPRICETVNEVMVVIKQHDGTKRARVKDGIILTCIQYVSKGCNGRLNANELAKKADLELKYVTKAEKIILELVNMNRLKLDKHIVLETRHPFDYVREVVRKHNLEIPGNVLEKVGELITVCEQRDILLDHTPLSVGVCCFYYMLKVHNISFDVKFFSELYDLSVVTVLKTYNKLKQHEHIIPPHLRET